MATVDRLQFSLQSYARSRPGWSGRMKLNVIMASPPHPLSCDVAEQFCWKGTACIALTCIGCLEAVSNELACRSVFQERDVLYFRALSKHCNGGVQETATMNNRFISRRLNCRTSGCDAEVPVNELKFNSRLRYGACMYSWVCRWRFKDNTFLIILNRTALSAFLIRLTSSDCSELCYCVV